jgi:spermidine/putrescine transport system ATP-binding protein
MQHSTAQLGKTTAISIDGLSKRFGTFAALDNVSLDVLDNEFFTLLGPSGCGKTTLLRIIAGFESLTSGTVRLFGDDIGLLPANRRPINTVFQQYALFPHMTVIENVMFGLLRQGKSRHAARRTASDVLELVRLGSFAERLPAQLSGGQQQRVALARALAPKPKVLLLDEPLSALDLKLRQAVRLELQQIQKETGITFVFVTHDQEEALTMSDRIAVFSAGQLQQIGSAQEIYEAPVNTFVADFIGETNLIDVMVTAVTNGRATCVLPGGRQIACPTTAGAAVGKGHISLRPERIAIQSDANGPLSGTATRLTYLGTDIHIDLRLPGGEMIKARAQNGYGSRIPAIGDIVGLQFREDAARLLVD